MGKRIIEIIKTNPLNFFTSLIYKPIVKLLGTEKHILYADEDDRDMLRDALLPFPEYSVITFSDGIELVAFLRQQRRNSVCLIVLDMNMPKMDGAKALAVIRNDIKISDLPAIIFTTSSNPHEKERIAPYNAIVMTKPSTTRELNRVAEQMIAYCPLRSQVVSNY